MTTELTAQAEQDTFTDEELDIWSNFGPALTDELVSLLEESANDSRRGFQRCLALLACARSADALSDISINEPEAFNEMLESVKAFKEHAEGLAAMAESAYLRLEIAEQKPNQHSKLN